MTSNHVPEGKYCRLHIRVRAEGCGFGRVVGVSGSCKGLGYFDPRKVLPLVTTPESYPVWFLRTPLLVPAEEMLTYKFCIIEGGQFKAFEELPSPRSVIPSSVDTIVENIFNPALIERSVYDSEARLLQVLDETQKDEPAATEDIGVHGSLYLLCYHLPVVVERTGTVPSFSVTWDDSLIARTDGVIADAMSTHWVGTVRVPGPPLTEVERAELIGILLRMSCVVIFVDEQTADAAYYGYCKQVLWPVFHNVDQLDGQGIWQTEISASSSEELRPVQSADSIKSEDSISFWNYTTVHTQWFNAYLRVNQLFCDAIKDRLHPQDVVWIHDYHLMMLPGMLRADSSPSLSIVFYLHIPFPTSQIFRSLPSASDIMKSLLQSDVVGFHTYQYARHFLNSGQRTVGATSHTLPGGLFSILSGGREVVLSMSVVSVEPTRLDPVLADPAVHEWAAALRAKHSGKKLIVSADLCQRLSGSVYKLAALECFLDEFCDSKQGEVVLVLRAVHSKARVNDEQQTSAELNSMVARLNKKYGRVVVDYEEPLAFSLRDRAGLWLAGDVFLNTAVREGLQMNAMEFIYARKDLKRSPGVVVVSDMSAAASLLSGSIKVSPFNTRQLADSLGKALSMSVAEADRRRQRDLPYVTTKTGSLWCKQVLMDLKHGKKSMGLEKCHYFQRAPFPTLLQQGALARDYSHAMLKDISPNLKRVFVFDYAGTLVQDEKQDIFFKQTMSSVSGKAPTPEMMQLLRALSEDPHNAVLVVTGLTRSKLGAVFDDYHHISVASSNGIECSWGTDVLTVAEADAARQDEERLKAGYASQEIIFDDDFKSVSSAHSQQDFHDLNDEHMRSIMRAEEEADADMGSFVQGAQGGRTLTEALSEPNLDNGRPVSFRQMALESTLRDSFMYHPQDVAHMHSVPSFGTYDNVLHAHDHDSQQSLAPRPRPPWNVIDESYLAIDWEAVKAIAVPIISKFSARSNGTCLISSTPGIGWSYFNAEPEWGKRQASQLKVELEASLANFNVKVDSLVDGSVEIVPRHFHKGKVVRQFLDRVARKRAGKLPTFMLAVGDDTDDDSMFQAVKAQVNGAATQFLPQNLALYTITVGKKRGSSAEYYVRDQADVEKVMREMVESDKSR